MPPTTTIGIKNVEKRHPVSNPIDDNVQFSAEWGLWKWGCCDGNDSSMQNDCVECRNFANLHDRDVNVYFHYKCLQKQFKFTRREIKELRETTRGQSFDCPNCRDYIENKIKNTNTSTSSNTNTSSNNNNNKTEKQRKEDCIDTSLNENVLAMDDVEKQIYDVGFNLTDEELEIIKARWFEMNTRQSWCNEFTIKLQIDDGVIDDIKRRFSFVLFCDINSISDEFATFVLEYCDSNDISYQTRIDNDGDNFYNECLSMYNQKNGIIIVDSNHSNHSNGNNINGNENGESHANINININRSTSRNPISNANGNSNGRNGITLEGTDDVLLNGVSNGVVNNGNNNNNNNVVTNGGTVDDHEKEKKKKNNGGENTNAIANFRVIPHYSNDAHLAARLQSEINRNINIDLTVDDDNESNHGDDSDFVVSVNELSDDESSLDGQVEPRRRKRRSPGSSKNKNNNTKNTNTNKNKNTNTNTNTTNTNGNTNENCNANTKEKRESVEKELSVIKKKMEENADSDDWRQDSINRKKLHQIKRKKLGIKKNQNMDGTTRCGRLLLNDAMKMAFGGSDDEGAADDDDDDESDDQENNENSNDNSNSNGNSKEKSKEKSKSKSKSKSVSKNKNKNKQVNREVLEALGWSKARIDAFMNKDTKPNAYYYRFLDRGEIQSNGGFTKEQHIKFMQRAKEIGVNVQWGIFSRTIPGKVGYQCSNHWRQLILNKKVEDPNYWYDPSEKKLHFRRKIPKDDKENYEKLKRYGFRVLVDNSGVFGKPSELPKGHKDAPEPEWIEKERKKWQNGAFFTNDSDKSKSKTKGKGKAKAKTTGRGKRNKAGSPSSSPSKGGKKVRKTSGGKSKKSSVSRSSRGSGRRRKKKNDDCNGDDDSDGEKERKMVEFSEYFSKYLDPISFKPIVKPMIDSCGHVIGYNNWLKVLKGNDKSEGVKDQCPYTRRKVTRRRLKEVTPQNFHLYKDQIIIVESTK